MKILSINNGAALVAASLLLGGCNGSGSSSDSSANTQPAVIDTQPKSQLHLGESIEYRYTLTKQQTLHILERPKYGQLTINDATMNYTASNSQIGTDQFRVEIRDATSQTTIKWVVRVDGDEPRFHSLALNDQNQQDHWQCVGDSQTHLGVSWAVPSTPQHQTFGWQDWDANLPDLEAQCFLGQSNCNTEALIEYANTQQWCGKSDWRLPYAYELKSLTSQQDFALDRNQAAIDPFFFPETGFEYYWLASDASDVQQDNLAHRYSFGAQNMQVSKQNKRKPASTMLVSGKFRDPSKPSEQIEPQSEQSSFIRLNDQGQPITLEKQTDEFSQTPWRCLDDMRGLVRDNFYLRDGKFSYVYWLTPNDNDITGTHNEFSIDGDSTDECGQPHCQLQEVLEYVNQGTECGRSDWRVPTMGELVMLLHQQVNGGGYELLYAESLNHPQQGEYWVSTESGYGTIDLPSPDSLTLSEPESGQRAKLLLVASEFEPRASEDPRSIGQHRKPNMTQLRQAYATSPDNWPAPFVDDMDEYQELGTMPKPKFPHTNPYQTEKVALGRDLFFDPFLSQDRDVSCASCHDPKKGWTDNLEVSIGHNRQHGKRNAPTIVNSAFLPSLFWDGRAADLEQQSLMPIQDPLEMAETLPNLIDRLNHHPSYPQRFKAVFHEETITQEQLSMALATFQRTIVSNPSRLDQFIEDAPNGETNTLSDQELWGLDIYRRNGRCVNCHMGPELTNHKFENVGLTYYKAFYEDLGQYNVDKNSDSVGKFKTPSLRDVMNTGPWFHNGLVHTMDGVISMYSEGMASNAPFGWDKYDPNYPKLSEKIRPLNLTFEEAQALKAFMQVITAPSPQKPASKEQLGQ